MKPKQFLMIFFPTYVEPRRIFYGDVFVEIIFCVTSKVFACKE